MSGDGGGDGGGHARKTTISGYLKRDPGKMFFMPAKKETLEQFPAIFVEKGTTVSPNTIPS